VIMPINPFKIAKAAAKPAAPNKGALSVLSAPEREANLQRMLAESKVQQRWQQALNAVNQHWDQLLAGAPALKSVPSWRLRWGRRLSRLKRLF
jgi:hypothetical protein